MKLRKVIVAAASVAALAAPALAQNTAQVQSTLQDIRTTWGFIPQFVQQAPQEMLPGAWLEAKSLVFSPSTAIDPRGKDLIRLGVSSQIPCPSCVYFDTRLAQAHGAVQRELQEATAMAALTRHWSAFLNGIQMGETMFRSEVDQAFNYMQQQQAQLRQPAGQLQKAPPSGSKPSSAILTPEDAYSDIKATFGSIPTFLQLYPRAGIVGAWRAMKDVQLNPQTALNGKEKELIGLAVASQVPCSYCAYFHTKAARMNGASDAEINEAISMASVTRQWSAIMSGTQADEATFRRDVDRLIQHLPRTAPRTPASSTGSQ